MRDVVTEADKARERVRRQLRQCVEECKPFLDKSIPLGTPALEGGDVIARYYKRKLLRFGSYGTYAGLHLTSKAQFGAMRSLGGRK